MKFRTLLLPFLLCVLVPTGAFSQPVMSWQKNIIHNNSGRIAPRITTVGDINGDGMPDIITGDSGAGMSWFKNIGNGNFASATFIIMATDLAVIQIADMDGDGLKDIVYINALTYWMKNLDGNGNFGAPITLSTTTYSTYGIQVIDMDNDGDMDIVQSRFTSSSSYYIEMLKNNGSGTFAAPVFISSSDSLVRFTVTDISGDTLPDVVYETTGAVLYRQQNANGTFPAAITENMGTTFNDMSSGIFNTGNVKGGDIDGDGDNDIVNVYQNGAARSIRWFRNDNNVFANSIVLLNIPTDANSSNVDCFTFRLSDLDGDGKVDIIIQNSVTNSITWYRNLGNSTFGAKQVISNTVLNNRDVSLSDINGDGKVDVITADNTNPLVKWFDNHNGNATSFIEHTIDDFVSYPFLAAVGDIDGNGTKDVVLASRNTSKLVWRSNTNGLGGFDQLPKVIPTSLPSYTSAVLIDANNDGHNDIVASSSGKIVWLANDGQGNFSNEQTLYASNNHTLIAQDVDNDGDKDLIAYYGYVDSQVTTSELKVFKNNGHGFDAPLIFSYPTNTFKNIEAVDMDSDGDLDFLIYLDIGTTQSPAGLYWIENTNGQGNYAALHPTNLALVSSKHFTVGDWNGDGVKDLIYTHRTGIGVRTVKTVTINADGTLGTPINLLLSGVDYGLLKLADLDNDGDLDILVEYNTGNTNFGWYENMGNGSFTLRAIVNATNPVTTPNFLEDINGDGKIDFAFTYNDNTSEVAWYQNLGLNYNQIKGKVSLDTALNGCASGSVAAQQVMVTTAESNSNATLSTFTALNGNYSFKVNPGNYATAVTTEFPYFNSSPGSVPSQFASNSGESIANFCLVPNQFFSDLEVSFYPLNDARPGFNTKYLMVAKNKGTNPINTSISLQYNNQKINFVNAAPGPLSQTANALVFNIANLQPFQTYQAAVTFQVKTIPAVTLGETIVFTVDNNLPNDITPATNSVQYNQKIVGAYDPNDMVVLEGRQVHIDNSDKYLHYLIRFQNTGNYFAERVLVTTLLDEKLDWKTIELEGSSHANRVEILNGSVMNFIFDAIYLPGRTTSEEGSKGYVAFKVKPKSTVVESDTVHGTASIYFDSNPAITTNQVATTFVTTLSVGDFEANKIAVYPNPANGMLNISSDVSIKTIFIYNQLGQLVLSATDASRIDVSSLIQGIYIMTLKDASGTTFTRKIIKR